MRTHVPPAGLIADRPLPDEIGIAVANIAARRSVIEQAKGMLMLVYAVDAESAFALLRHVSQHHNVKLRCVAEQTIADFAAAFPVADGRAAYDRLLFSMHERVRDGHVCGYDAS